MAGPISIPALPYDFALPPSGTALIVIDMQRDFIEPGGFGAALGNDVSTLQPAIEPVRRLLRLFRARGWPIIHTRESHRPDLSDCPPRSACAARPACAIGDAGPMGRILVRGEPAPRSSIPVLRCRRETEIDKPGKGAFHATDLQAILQAKGITHLVFAGVTTEVCVQTTMREANDRGYECLVVEEATESYFPAFKEATLAMIRAQGGIVGWTARLADVEKALS